VKLLLCCGITVSGFSPPHPQAAAPISLLCAKCSMREAGGWLLGGVVTVYSYLSPPYAFGYFLFPEPHTCEF
jgi:hypothetical protein